MSAHKSPEQIRSQLKHPVVDGDGHWLEYAPVFSEKMRKAAGDKSAEGFLAALRSTTDALKMSPEERRRRRIAQPNFWNRQAENTLDRATAMMPKMLYERLDEIGLDFAIVYPTAGLRLPRIKDDETRRAVIRGYNIVSAEYFQGLEDRLTPAAIIPMHHPEEAIAELEFVTKQLGSKVGMFGSGMSRQIAATAANDPESQRFTVSHDVLAIDSPHDYDPVWKKCVELGIAPTFHSSASGQGLRNSPSNFVYNHIGHFAAGKITRKQDWIDLYATPFYFGCEADDRMNATAFGKGNPFGARLNAIFSSDIGHFDVIDFRDPLRQAHDLVDKGLITDDDFRDFTFANTVRLWGTQNPRFFEGTIVAKEAAAVLNAPAVKAAAD